LVSVEANYTSNYRGHFKALRWLKLICAQPGPTRGDTRGTSYPGMGNISCWGPGRWKYARYILL